MNRRQWKKLVRQCRCPWCKPRNRFQLQSCGWLAQRSVGAYWKIVCFHCGRTAVISQAKEAKLPDPA